MAKAIATPQVRKLKALLKEVSADRLAVAQSLVEELCFMQRTLEKLRQQVDEEGGTALFEQGKQCFLREHPALKAYSTLVQRYSLLYKQLVDLLPKSVQPQAQDALAAFVAR